ncbi:MAG: hypothetical protein CPDRYMAC_0258 [uncultured Paraburkholderia sp.]|nr:MAG: hypothetical protein CPDRYDRY_0256 [uncultured Paraburkholderia sp.]CAH2910659.1 MAG: hypothetical protein CPDRYMAC_0258 [uncultured Paraburkholderia sp.]
METGLFAILFVLLGGSVGVAILAWVEHRRGRKDAKSAMKLAAPVAKAGTTVSANAAPAGACQSRGDAPCRTAAGKQARQTKATDSRV